jgi:hypothetical protein
MLSRFSLGARIASDRDVISLWGTVTVAYAVNLVVAFAVVAAIFTLLGYYEPIHSPLAKSALQVPLAVSNLLAFVLTYITSLGWKMHDDAIARQRAANRSRGEYLVLLFVVSIASLFFMAALFLIFDVATLAASAVVNAALLQMLFSNRCMETRNQG